MLTATYHDRTLFPGQDYNNARVLDFQVRYNRHGCTVGDIDLSWDYFRKSTTTFRINSQLLRPDGCLGTTFT